MTRYRLHFDVENTGDPVDVTLSSVSLNPQSGSAIELKLTCKDEVTEFPLAVGEERGSTFTSEVSGDISNGTATASFLVVNSEGEQIPVTQTFEITSLNPCGGHCESVLPGEADPESC